MLFQPTLSQPGAAGKQRQASHSGPSSRVPQLQPEVLPCFRCWGIRCCLQQVNRSILSPGSCLARYLQLLSNQTRPNQPEKGSHQEGLQQPNEEPKTGSSLQNRCLASEAFRGCMLANGTRGEGYQKYHLVRLPLILVAECPNYRHRKTPPGQATMRGANKVK